MVCECCFVLILSVQTHFEATVRAACHNIDTRKHSREERERERELKGMKPKKKIHPTPLISFEKMNLIFLQSALLL